MAGPSGTADERALARRWALAHTMRETLIRLARRKGLSHADAEDCVQEAFIQVVPRPDLDEARIGGLLVTVVSRRAIDMHRRSRSAKRASHRLESIASTEPHTPEDQLCDRAEAEWSANIVSSLPPLQRRVLLARAQGRSWNDIAAEMSTSVKAVESAVSRARAAMRGAIASTLGIAAALARRWRPATSNTTATVASGAAAVVLVAFAIPLLHNAPTPRDDAADRRRDVLAEHAAAPVSTGTSNTPAPATVARHDGDHRSVDLDRADGAEPERPPRARTYAAIPVPAENGVARRVWVEAEEKEQDHVTYITTCLQHYRVSIESDGGAVPDVNADCDQIEGDD